MTAEKLEKLRKITMELKSIYRSLTRYAIEDRGDPAFLHRDRCRLKDAVQKLEEELK